jgi:hypothetical protein
MALSQVRETLARHQADFAAAGLKLRITLLSGQFALEILYPAGVRSPQFHEIDGIPVKVTSYVDPDHQPESCS